MDSLRGWYDSYSRIATCALENMKAAIANMGREFEVSYDVMPFDLKRTRTRIKSFDSLIDKCERRHYAKSVGSILENVCDIAGMRIITRSVTDIYVVAREIVRLARNNDSLTLVEMEDYVANVKPNGYRSMHLSVIMKTYFGGEQHDIAIELQIRTKSMNLWSEFEHDARYKRIGLKGQLPEEELNASLANSAAAMMQFDRIQDLVFNGEGECEKNREALLKEYESVVGTDN